ncbi:CstF-50 [Strongyloides ratti]|uniref:Cleavage stimulation factor 50 kDa subunit n=1 Tax=Strongyloides ratti TaxID=34506 RepID=A0A090LGB3_STRRB|nr:CstF-50 [Strongyloides ratti]CEF67168.1 CstF-50 [Strongyloides ratti]
MMKVDIKDRDTLYRLIIEQLLYDGYQQVANNLFQTIGNTGKLPPPCNKLFKVVQHSLHDGELNDEVNFDEEMEDDEYYQGYPGLDLEYDADVPVSSPEPSLYETIFLTTHKGPSRAVAFSEDGKLAATGSQDCTIKIIDIEKVVMKESGNSEFDANPVIRTLYDHSDEVTCLAFHPKQQLLVSGSSDKTLKFFDYAKSAVRRAMRSITEVERLNAISFHPSGDYIAVGTENKVLRLYSTETQQCWVSLQPLDQHIAAIKTIDYTCTGNLLASGSSDGDIKIWDGVSGRCIETFQKAHDGDEICSVQFTKNGKYILSSGFDSVVKLWELSTNRCLNVYHAPGFSSQRLSVNAEFNHTEDFILFPDEKSCNLNSWDSRTTEKKKFLPLGHTAPVRKMKHAPNMAMLITCSDDSRVRFWYKKYKTKQYNQEHI